MRVDRQLFPASPLRRFAHGWCLRIVVASLALSGCADRVTSDDRRLDGAHAATEEVSIPTDGLELEGTLRLPSGDPPYPGLVIVHGSGPQSRDGLLPGQLGLTLPEPVPVYDQLAEGLRERGYAVLTWDKRTCGPFNGCAENGYPSPAGDIAFDTFGQDVDAVLDHLAARDDIRDLTLIGHSQGGTIAAELAAERRGLDAVVLLATPAIPIDEVLAAQADKLAELVTAAGQQGTAADQAVAQISDLAGEVADIAEGEIGGADVGGASRRFWASWIEASRNAPQQLRSTDVPVLALGGEHDWNVPPEQVRAWEPYLPRGSRVEVLPEITHALTRLGTDDPAAVTPEDLGTSVATSVTETIASWLDASLDR